MPTPSPLFVDTARGRLALLSAGDAGSPLVICLHGFPDLPFSLHPLCLSLAREGYRAVAPFLRGYAPSPLVGPFTPEALADDARALADALSPGAPAALVGHDWGAVGAYSALARAPSRFRAAVTLSVPHPGAFLANLGREPGQWRRSAYMLGFQLRGLAERALAARDFSLVDRLYRAWSPALSPEPAHLARVKRCLEQSLPAPLTYYRSLFAPARAALARAREAGELRISAPTLHLTGAEDGCIAPSLGRGQGRFFTGPFRSEVIPSAGHFLPLEQPREIARRVLSFLGPAQSCA